MNEYDCILQDYSINGERKNWQKKIVAPSLQLAKVLMCENLKVTTQQFFKVKARLLRKNVAELDSRFISA